jgi:hypothetical protein
MSRAPRPARPASAGHVPDPIDRATHTPAGPPWGGRSALLQVDLAGLRSAGYEIPEISRVSGAYGMAGGGYEMQFPCAVPPEFLKVIWP